MESKRKRKRDVKLSSSTQVRNQKSRVLMLMALAVRSVRSMMVLDVKKTNRVDRFTPTGTMRKCLLKLSKDK